MAGENTANFTFGTNVTQIADEVVSNVGRIDRALAGADLNLGGENGQLNTAAFERDLQRAQERIRKLMADFGSGKINTTQFQEQYAKQIKDATRGSQRAFADAVAESPASVASTIDTAKVARTVGQTYVRTLVEELRAGDAKVRAAIEGLNPGQQFNGVLNGLRGPAYGFESTRKNTLTNAVRQQAQASNSYSPAKVELSDIKAEEAAQVKAEQDQRRLATQQIQAQREDQQRRNLASRQEVASARQQLAAARAAERDAQAIQKAQNRYQAGQGGALQGFFGRLGSGGQSLTTNIGSHVASAAQFSLGYGALFAAQGAVRDTVAEYKDYQDSLTDLQVATRNTGAVTDQWVNSLSDVARVTGENVGAALDTAARGIRAFGDPVHDTVKDLQDIGSASNDAANKLALISNKSLTDATGDLIAVGTSYGLQPDQLSQVNDAVANAKRNLGGDPAQISQGLASIASSAGTAGYNVNQAADLVSLVQGRTDETGLAAATRLTRIFQTTSGTTGKALGRELGVNTDQSTRKQLEDYAAIYNDQGTSGAVKDRITSQLGGTANLRELLAVLQNIGDLTQADAESAKNAGAANQEFNRKADSLAGTLKKITGDVKAIQVDFGRTDLGAPFAAAIKTIEPLLHLIDRLLQQFDALPQAIKLPLALLADVAIANKAVSVVKDTKAAIAARNGGAGAGVEARTAEAAAINAATEARIAAEVRLTEAINGAATARGVAEAKEDAVIVEAGAGRAAAEAAGTGERVLGDVAGAGRFGRLGKAGKTLGRVSGITGALEFASNPFVLGAGAAIGAGVLVNKGFDASEQVRGYTNTYDNTSAAYSRSDGTAASLSKTATDLRSAAGAIRRSESNFFSSRAQKQTAADLTQEAKQTTILEKRAAAEEKANATAAKTSVFGDGSGVITSVTELTDGLAALADSGATAGTQVRLLAKALDDTTTPKSGVRFQPAQVSGKLAQQAVGDALRNSLGDSVALAPNAPRNAGAAEQNYLAKTTQAVNVDGDRAYKMLRSGIDVSKVGAAVDKQSAALGLKKGDLFTSKDNDKLARAAVNAIGLDKVATKEARDNIRAGIFNAITGRSDGAFGAISDGIDGAIEGAFGGKTKSRQLNGKGKLSRDTILSLFKASADGKFGGIDALFQAQTANIPASDDGTKLQAVQRQQLGLLKRLAARNSGKDIGQLSLLIANTEDALATTTIANLETLRKAAQSRAKGKDNVRAVGRGFLAKEINAAGSDTKQLISIMDNADKQSLDIVQSHLKQLADVSTASETALDLILNPLTAGLVAGGAIKKPKTQAQKDYQAFLRARRRANVTNDPYGGSFAGGGDSANANSAENKMTAAQRAAQIRQANEDPRNDLAVARNSMLVAKANFDALQKGDDGYYEALKTYRESQVAYANQQNTQAANAIQLAAARAGGGAMANAIAQIKTGQNLMALNPVGSQGYSDGQLQVVQGELARRQANVAKATAMGQARAARVGGGLAAAKAQINGAAYNLSIQAKGTGEWWEALGNFYQGQDAMREAVLQYKTNLDLLKGDSTDPVEQARDAMRAAARKLAQDRRRGAGKDVVAQDQVDAQNARNSLQASKFDQRFSDMQTAEDLGRISFSKYMNYLDHEHDRLSAIKKRTRQQQDQLNQVDSAMKQALSQMDSQFNLGDINTNGLVYQVRRFAAEEKSARGSSARTAAATTNQTVSISINGADVGAVKNIIATYLNINGGQRRTLARRKV